MSGYEVGQQVWVYRAYGGNGPRQEAVEKVGRKLLTIGGLQYRMGTHYLNGDFPAHGWFKTDDQRAEDDRKEVAEAWLRSRGVRLDPGAARRLAADTLDRLVAILDEEPSC